MSLIIDPLRPDYFAPDAETDERALQGIPGNIGHASDTTILLLAEFSRRNSDALVLSATGVDLDSNLTVSAGHKHDDRDTSLDWMASQSFLFAAGAGVTGGDLEGYLVTFAQTVGIGFLQMPLRGADSLGLYASLRWRARARVPATGYTSCTLTVTLEIIGPEDPTLPLITRQLAIAYNLAEDDAWTEGPPAYDATNLTYLFNAADGIFLVRVTANVDTQAATLYEVQIQWGPQ